MAEELKNLLDKIQKDGIDKAQAESEKIIAEAKAKAKKIIEKAKEDADAAAAKAETESKLLEERGKTALGQAARDVILSLSDSITNALKSIVSVQTSGILKDDALKELISTVIESYCKEGLKESRIEILLNPADQEKLKSHFTAAYAEEMKKGLEIKGDSEVISGFKVSVVNDTIQHDFSGEAITEALCKFLRPYLAEIVRGAGATGES